MSRKPDTAPVPALFSPLKLRGLELRNRIVLSPMCQYEARDGHTVDWHQVHHARYAMSGIAAGFVEATAVSTEGRITHGCTGLWNDAQIAGMAGIARMYERFGVIPAIQLSHAGWKASAQRPTGGAGPLPADDPEGAWQTVGPSPLACRQGWPAARAMTAADIEKLKQDWRAATRRALRAGFRIIEIHGAHGYLIHSFLSPLSNHRKDAWGGTLEGRMRLAIEIAELTRAEWPSEWPVFFRISATDDDANGWTIEDSVILSRELAGHGIDVIDCSSGGLQSIPPSGRLALPQGFQVPYAAKIRQETGARTMAVGLITGTAFANDIVARGEADLVALARELMADPGWPLKAALDLGFSGALEVLPTEYRLYLQRRGWRR